MQTLSVWPSHGEFWGLAQSSCESEPIWVSTKRRRRWPELGLVWVNAIGGRRKLDKKLMFLSGYSSSRAAPCYELKKDSLGVFFALPCTLEQEEIGIDEPVKESLVDVLEDKTRNKEVGCRDLDCRVSDDSEKKVVDSLENGNMNDQKDRRLDVRELASSLVSAKDADDVQEVLKDKEDLPLKVFSSMIKGFGKEKKLDPALALVEWLQRRKKETGGSMGPNTFVYNSLLGAVKESKKYELVERIMHDMATEDVSPDVVTYNTLMAICLEQGKNTEALNFFNEISRQGLSPSPASYSTALIAYRGKEDGFGALQFFVDFREQHLKGNIGTDGNSNVDWDIEFAKLEDFTMRICYQVMRRWLVSSDGLITDVLNLLTDMDKAGLQPSREESERLVWACTREEQHTVAKVLYKRIRERHSEVRLSVCNHAIWLMGKAKKWWAALEIYEDLLEKGPEPNKLSYELIASHFNVLLTAARRKGIWKWGVSLLNKMEDKGIKPSTRDWNAVLVACSKSSETNAAVQIFKRMVEKGEKPTIVSYGALLSALEKGKLYDEAFRVWDHMLNVGVQPNLYAYTTMASICVGHGSFNLVDSIVREMASTGNDPTVVTYNAIITGFARKEMGSMAYEWFHRMKVQNVNPNEITYEMLIEALAKDEKPRLAYELYMRAHQEGLSLSSKAYDAVIQSSQTYEATIDVGALGPRPCDNKKGANEKKSV